MDANLLAKLNKIKVLAEWDGVNSKKQIIIIVEELLKGFSDDKLYYVKLSQHNINYYYSTHDDNLLILDSYDKATPLTYTEAKDIINNLIPIGEMVQIKTEE